MPRVRTIDFRRPTKFARELVRRLEHAHEGFCRSSASRLSAELRTAIELRVAATDQLPFVAAVDELPQDALVAVVNLEALGTRMAVIIELDLAATLVDRMLGAGKAARTDASGGLTEVEVAVLRRAIASLVETLSATWMEIAETPLSVVGIENSPVTVQLVPPSEPTLVMTLAIQIEDSTSPLRFLIPYRSIEAVVERIANPLHGFSTEDNGSSQAVQQAVRRVEVELRAEVGEVDMTLEEVRSLGEGDLIRLRRTASKGVLLRAGDVAAYVATPGRNGNARAVQIKEPWCEP